MTQDEIEEMAELSGLYLYKTNEELIYCLTYFAKLVSEKSKQEQDEPVGWIDSKGNMICTKINESCKPLYTTPQTKEWVSLTDEDMEFLFPHGKSAWLTETLKVFEAKLKEKNH